MAISHRHLEVFRAIMTTGGVTGAAAVLHTSQPTVSRELVRLERLLGFALFDRVRGRLQATARAHILFDEVQRSYIGLERILTTASNLSQFHQGQLSIACVPAFSHALLPAVCRRFLTDQPQVSIAITPQDSPLLEEWLTAQRHDLGLTEHDVAPPATRLELLLAADEVCVLPEGHPLLAKTTLEPADFSGERFISLAPTDPYRLQVDAIFGEHRVARRMVMETHSAVSVCSLVREGLGLAIVNPLTALAFTGAGVSMRRFSVSVPFRVSVVRPQYRASTPLADDFVKHLKEEAAAILRRLPL